MPTEQRRLNEKKSLALASDLFPDEEWILKEPHIWVGKSRVRDTPKLQAHYFHGLMMNYGE